MTDEAEPPFPPTAAEPASQAGAAKPLLRKRFGKRSPPSGGAFTSGAAVAAPDVPLSPIDNPSAASIQLFIACLALGIACAALSATRIPLLHTIGLIGPLAATILYPLIGVQRGYHRRPSTAEKFADNCYYLGFIFTQSSLLFAFIPVTLFGQRVESSDVLRFFGVAIGASMIGLIARTWFTQTSASAPEVGDALQSEVQDLARHVADQAKAIMSEFDNLFTAVSTLPARMDQRLEAQIGSIGEALSSFDTSVHAGASSFADRRDRIESEIGQAGARIVEQSELLSERTAKAAAAIMHLTTAFEERAGQSLESIKILTSGLENSTRVLGALARADADIDAFERRIAELGSMGKQVEGAIASLQRQLSTDSEDAARSVTDAAEAAAKRIANVAGGAAEQMEAASVQSLERLRAREAEFSSQMRQSIEEFGAAVAAFREELARIRG